MSIRSSLRETRRSPTGLHSSASVGGNQLGAGLRESTTRQACAGNSAAEWPLTIELKANQPIRHKILASHSVIKRTNRSYDDRIRIPFYGLAGLGYSNNKRKLTSGMISFAFTDNLSFGSAGTKVRPHRTRNFDCINHTFRWRGIRCPRNTSASWIQNHPLAKVTILSTALSSSGGLSLDCPYARAEFHSEYRSHENYTVCEKGGQLGECMAMI